MATTNILQFAPTDIGTNLLTDAQYLAALDRTNGNQPGVASSKLVNKALRQASAMAAGAAQFLANNQGTNVTDGLTPATLAAMWLSAIQAIAAGQVPAQAGKLLNLRVLLTTQVYNATAGTNSVLVLTQGGGGAGGGVNSTGAGQVAAGAGGGGGGWAIRRILSGFSGVTVTVGAAGAPSAGGPGGNGGTTSFGGLVSGSGGSGGSVGPAGSVFGVPNGTGAPGGGTGGDMNFRGGMGNYAFYVSDPPTSGGGGFSFFGGGAPWVTSSGANGPAAVALGSGGGGAAIGPSVNGFSVAGGAGGAGACVIWEYS